MLKDKKCFIFSLLHNKVACECRRISGFGGDKRQPEIRLRSQANNKETPDNLLMI